MPEVYVNHPPLIIADPLPWLSYVAGLPMARLEPVDVDGLAARRPADLLLAAVTEGPPTATTPSAPCLTEGAVRGRYALVPATVRSPMRDP